VLLVHLKFRKKQSGACTNLNSDSFGISRFKTQIKQASFNIEFKEIMIIVFVNSFINKSNIG